VPSPKVEIEIIIRKCFGKYRVPDFIYQTTALLWKEIDPLLFHFKTVLIE
jgi:hypothetical protein